MDNKVNFLRGTATEYEASTKDNDTFYYTTDDEKLYLGNKEITGGGVTIDNALSDTSKNPVQNKVITNALNTKANLTDIPTTLPANGGNAATVNGRSIAGINSLVRYTCGNYDCNTTISTGVYRGTFTNYPSNLPDGQGTLLVMNYSGENSEISGTVGTDIMWIRQWFICPHGYYVYERVVANTAVSAWAPINDGGNAATVNGLTVQTAVPANAKFTDTVYVHPSYTARTGVPTANVAPAFGGTFTVSQPVSDATGHITAINSRTITIPSTAASASAAGLVSTGAQTLAGNKTFKGQVIPAGASAVGTAQARKIYAGTSDMTAGTTALETGAIYLVYE